MRVLVCGDRHWTRYWPIVRELYHLKERFPGETFTIVEGEAPGADTIARIVAEALGYPVEKHPADWNGMAARGLPRAAAGPIRNKEMLEAPGGIDLVLAFHANLERSRGTKNMVSQATARGVPVEVYGN